MNGKRVYDLPTRTFHWLFALFFVLTFTISNTVEDKSAIFSYHMLSGMVLLFLVIFRVTWGFLGTKHARFTGFAFKPIDLINYLKGIQTASNYNWIGHNPASSWASIIMIFLTLGLGVTGLLVSNVKGAQALKEVHELLANGFLIVVIMHISGVVLHSIKYKDKIWKSMINGKKTNLPEDLIRINSYKSIGVLLLVATICISVYLVKNFDYKNRSVTIIGSKVSLTKPEKKEHRIHRSEEHKN